MQTLTYEMAAGAGLLPNAVPVFVMAWPEEDVEAYLYGLSEWGDGARLRRARDGKRANGGVPFFRIQIRSEDAARCLYAYHLAHAKVKEVDVFANAHRRTDPEPEPEAETPAPSCRPSAYDGNFGCFDVRLDFDYRDKTGKERWQLIDLRSSTVLETTQTGTKQARVRLQSKARKLFAQACEDWKAARP